MAIVQNAPGTQVVLADGKVIHRKTQIATAGERMSPPNSPGILKSIQITDDAAGVRRGVWEFVESDTNVPEGEAGQYPVIELLGGSREVPVQTHPKLASISADRIKQITRAVETEVVSAEMPDDLTNDEENLVALLRREIRYFLTPAVSARVTEIESSLPDLEDLTTLGGASGLPQPPTGKAWIMTGVSARSVGNKYEVTREYTMTGEGSEAAEFLYD
jgi:hypothetical protein